MLVFQCNNAADDDPRQYSHTNTQDHGLTSVRDECLCVELAIQCSMVADDLQSCHRLTRDLHANSIVLNHPQHTSRWILDEMEDCSLITVCIIWIIQQFQLGDMRDQKDGYNIDHDACGIMHQRQPPGRICILSGCALSNIAKHSFSSFEVDSWLRQGCNLCVLCASNPLLFVCSVKYGSFAAA